MSSTSPDPDVASLSVTGVAEGMRGISVSRDLRRVLFGTGENIRFSRHEQVLARWPVLGEDWATRVENARIAAVDRTPGNATFGR